MAETMRVELTPRALYVQPRGMPATASLSVEGVDGWDVEWISLPALWYRFTRTGSHEATLTIALPAAEGVENSTRAFRVTVRSREDPPQRRQVTATLQIGEAASPTSYPLPVAAGNDHRRRSLPSFRWVLGGLGSLLAVASLAVVVHVPPRRATVLVAQNRSAPMTRAIRAATDNSPPSAPSPVAGGGDPAKPRTTDTPIPTLPRVTDTPIPALTATATPTYWDRRRGIGAEGACQAAHSVYPCVSLTQAPTAGSTAFGRGVGD